MINDISRFVNEFRNCEFRHRDRLISGIEAGTITLHSVNENGLDRNSNYLATYRVRLINVDRRIETEPTLANKSLRDDCEALCRGLLQNLEDYCDMWIFDHDQGGVTWVFVSRGGRMVMGCVSSHFKL